MGVSAEAEQVLWARDGLNGKRHDGTKRVLTFGLMMVGYGWYILVVYLMFFGIFWLGRCCSQGGFSVHLLCALYNLPHDWSKNVPWALMNPPVAGDSEYC